MSTAPETQTRFDRETTLVAQLDPGRSQTWWRLIRRDHVLGSEHVIIAWTIANTPKTAEAAARRYGAELIEIVEPGS